MNSQTKQDAMLKEAMLEHRLTARYTDDEGTVLMTGLQALARLPIEQMRADRAAGQNTATLITGYPGSPLGGFDKAVDEAIAVAGEGLAIHHQPAVNEEQAATAIMGSQLACTRPDARFDGVVGIWYGKAPGVDRATDAIRHGVFAGSDPGGGAVLIAGDDPAAKSSTIPSSSAGGLADMHVPVLYPGTPADALRLGRHAVAMSRCTGLWVGLKIVADVADGASTVTLDPSALVPVMPAVLNGSVAPAGEGQRYVHKPDGHLLTPRTVEIEQEIYEVRYELAIEYAKQNRLNAVTVDSADDWIGIVASGITYRELREALRRLGLPHDSQLSAAGVRLLRMDMPIPFSAARAQEFAKGLSEIMVVEEKSPNIESLLKDALYHRTERPVIVGKRDEQDRILFAGHGALNADDLIEPLRQRLSSRLADKLTPPESTPERINIPVKLHLQPPAETSAKRTPFFCSGCPHNRSVRVPDGAVVGAGIGCHTMALLLRPDQVGDLVGITSMGQEGSQWIGMAPFVQTPHIFQNLGDGTYFHSGRMAIAGAVAAGVDITFKLLWNRHVAMTGGQDPQGALELGSVCQGLLSTGVKRILITTDDTAAYDKSHLPEGIEVWDRKRLIEAQELLAETDGVTVLVHDQQCAAEARRERKRGLVPTPTKRVVINERVCEGCGDCGQISNCLSVQPVDTFFGRKTRIDQTSCNLDFSCTEGDCPSFMEVRQAGPFRTAVREMLTAWDWRKTSNPRAVLQPPEQFPEPPQLYGSEVGTQEIAVRMCGIGGTGVVTIGQVLGTAALFDGYQTRGLDQIGLSQKAGPVVGDLRLSRSGGVATSRVGAKQADLLLAFDQLVAASPVGVDSCEPGRTVVVGSTSPTPTGAMITDADVEMPSKEDLSQKLAEVSRSDAQFWVDAAELTTALLGSSVTANVLVVGMAIQSGGLPISPAAVRHAIELNGVAVEANLAAFNWGRAVVSDPQLVAESLAAAEPPSQPNTQPSDQSPDQPSTQSSAQPSAKNAALAAEINALSERHAWPEKLSHIVIRYANELVDYQSTRLADRYLATLSQVADNVQQLRSELAGELVAAAAAGLFKLMAYKDEYEVARLMLDKQATAEARQLARSSGGYVVWMLHPPVLRAMGVDRKIGFTAAWRPLFWLLKKMRWMRGRWFDPFGHFEVRRTERALIREYTSALLATTENLANPQVNDQAEPQTDYRADYQAALGVARAPELVRGYEHIKLAGIDDFRSTLASSAFD